MDANTILDRRTFITELGRGAFALTIFSIVGCAPALPSVGSPAPGSSVGGPGASGSGRGSGGLSSVGAGGLQWARVNLGFVSAYVLVRAGEPNRCRDERHRIRKTDSGVGRVNETWRGPADNGRTC